MYPPLWAKIFDQICCSQVQMTVPLPKNVISVIHLGSESINLPENTGLHLPWKLRYVPLQSFTSIGPPKSGGRHYWWIEVLLNFSFSDICLSEYPSSCNAINLSTPDNTLSYPYLQQKNLQQYWTFLLPRRTRLLKISLLEVVTEGSFHVKSPKKIQF